MSVLTRQLSPVEQFLCRLVTDWNAEEQLEAYHRIGDQAAFDAATANDVAPIVGHRLTELLGEDGVQPRWKHAHEASLHLITAYMNELDRIATLLAQRDIPMVALKNSGIARGIYSCVGCSPMGDMDVLVERRSFRAAHEALVEDGFRFEFRSPLEEPTIEAAERGGGAEYSRVLPDGNRLWFELQWRPVAGRWIRPDQEPTAEELMECSSPIPGSAVRLLEPTDNLLQVALHAAKHSYIRSPGFRLNLDVDRITRYQQIDWERFVGRVRHARVKTPVFFALALPHELLRSPVPNDVLAQLAPPRWKRRAIAGWLERAGLFNPEQRKFGNVAFLAFSSLLYDDVSGLGRAMFPDRSWMQEQYEIRHPLLLPAYHARRLASLIFRRTL